MKILLTTDTIGGVWTYCMELCGALREITSLPPLPPGEGWGEGELRMASTSRGLDVAQPPSAVIDRRSMHCGAGFPTCTSDTNIQIALATMGAPLTPAQRQDLKSLPHVTLFESQYKLEWMPNPWDDIESAGRWLLDIADSFNPDLIHLNTYPHASLPWNTPVLTVAHSCVLSWWQAVKSEPAPSEWNTYRRAVRDGLRASDLVVAPSAAMLDSASALYGPLPQTRVIPNARDASLFHPAPKQPEILSAGRLWDEAKNVAALARVASKITWPVNVAGEGGESLPDNIRWLGRLSLPEMAAQLSRAAIYALPARYEPFGLSVLEAALSGCALVLGDIPSLRENWSDAALFVDPNDDDRLAHTLNKLTSDTALRQSLASAAMARSRRFTPERFASDYLTAYRDLLSPLQTAEASRPHIERIPVCGS